MKLFLPLAFLLPVALFAQPQVKISDPGALVLRPELGKNKAATAALQAAGLTAEAQELVVNYSDPKYWPPGLSTDSARQANAPYLQNYAAYRICKYEVDSLPYVIVMLPAQQNIHMPEDMRPLADVYLLLPDSAAKDVRSGKPRPLISRGPRWKDRPKAKIVKPDGLYATYDLGDDEAGREALKKKYMSDAEIEAVVFRSHERNWPDGIDSFDERFPRLEQFSKYKAYVGAEWDDKVLLIIPVEKNRKLPTAMRPYMDLYFVYAKDAVEVKGKRK